jgi:hypothetical protein
MCMPESELINMLLRVGWKQENEYVYHLRLAEISVWRNPSDGRLAFSPD